MHVSNVKSGDQAKGTPCEIEGKGLLQVGINILPEELPKKFTPSFCKVGCSVGDCGLNYNTGSFGVD
jgi:hypothetical protein